MVVVVVVVVAAVIVASSYVWVLGHTAFHSVFYSSSPLFTSYINVSAMKKDCEKKNIPSSWMKNF